MSKIKLGIIGVGNMGTGHIGNIMAGKCPEIELSAVCDIDENKKDWIDKNAPGTPFFDEAEKMMDSGLIDSVLVAVPHYDHPKYAMMAMKKGLHVMVEKPAGVYTNQVVEMNECAKQCDVVFGMMFNQRTNSCYKKMRELVKSGKYGQIRRTSWIITNWFRTQSYYDSGAWRATWSGEGGGVLLNQCPHNLDLWQWICGMPVKIDAKLSYGKWHDIEVEDDVTAYAEYENGATGTFITTTGDAPGTNRFEITMDGAKIVCENNKLMVWELETSVPDQIKNCKNGFELPKCSYFEPEFDQNDNPQHVGVLNAFAAAILRGEPLVADGSEGINGLMISNAMHLSSWLGRPVELPLDGDLFYSELMKRVATSRRKTGSFSSAVADLSGTYNSK